MNKYKTKKFKFGWIGTHQWSINLSPFFYSRGCFIHSKLHPATELLIGFLGFVLPVIERHRSLFFFRWYTWNEKKAGFLSISFLWLPDIDFRIGNQKTWFWIRCENIYAMQCSRRNKKQAKKMFGDRNL